MFMKIDELKSFLEKEGLLPMNYYGCPKYYVSRADICNIGRTNNLPDVFGVYRVAESEACVFFITDSERGMRCHNEVFSTEEEACEHIIKRAQTSKVTFLNENNTFANNVVPQSVQSIENEKYTYYKFDIGNGAMML